MLIIPLNCHTTPLRGVARLTVDLDDDRYVRLSVDAEPGETFDDRDVDRQLLPAEARALAAALWHYAGEAG